VSFSSYPKKNCHQVKDVQTLPWLFYSWCNNCTEAFENANPFSGPLFASFYLSAHLRLTFKTCQFKEKLKKCFSTQGIPVVSLLKTAFYSKESSCFFNEKCICRRRLSLYWRSAWQCLHQVGFDCLQLGSDCCRVQCLKLCKGRHGYFYFHNFKLNFGI